MKIALIHDYLDQSGGAERVLLAFKKMYPEAPIYTLLHVPRKSRMMFVDHQVINSFIHYLPFGKSHLHWFLPLIPLAFRCFNLSQFDLILSSASGHAKNVKVDPEKTLHICYCYSPTRYLWDYQENYISELRKPKWVKKLLPLIISSQKRIDYKAAQRVDHFIADSSTVADRIKKYYNRSSSVIFPPADTHQINLDENKEDYYLIVGRMRPYKRLDLVIESFNQLGLALKIIGDGEERVHLEKLAHGNIEFLGDVTDQERNRYFEKAKGYLFPQLEDFGIVPVEAMAAGTPVIAYNKGGALDTIKDGITGILFEEQTVSCLTNAIQQFEGMEFDHSAIRKHAESFSHEIFKNKIKAFVQEKYQEFKNK